MRETLSSDTYLLDVVGENLAIGPACELRDTDPDDACSRASNRKVTLAGNVAERGGLKSLASIKLRKNRALDPFVHAEPEHDGLQPNAITKLIARGRTNATSK